MLNLFKRKIKQVEQEDFNFVTAIDAKEIANNIAAKRNEEAEEIADQHKELFDEEFKTIIDKIRQTALKGEYIIWHKFDDLYYQVANHHAAYIISNRIVAKLEKLNYNVNHSGITKEARISWKVI